MLCSHYCVTLSDVIRLVCDYFWPEFEFEFEIFYAVYILCFVHTRLLIVCVTLSDMIQLVCDYFWPVFEFESELCMSNALFTLDY